MPQSASDKTLLDRIESDFTYHAPDMGQTAACAKIRAQARDFALTIAGSCPNGRESSLALTKLQEAVFWANQAITHNSATAV